MKLNDPEVVFLLLTLALPQINPHMSFAIINSIHASVDAALPVGAKLLDLTVDLSAAAPHDCPPVSYFRLMVRERVWLRRLDVATGDEPEVGANIALFSTDPNERLDNAPTRTVRLAIAGIISQSGWNEG